MNNHRLSKVRNTSPKLRNIVSSFLLRWANRFS